MPQEQTLCCNVPWVREITFLSCIIFSFLIQGVQGTIRHFPLLHFNPQLLYEVCWSGPKPPSEFQGVQRFLPVFPRSNSTFCTRLALNRSLQEEYCVLVLVWHRIGSWCRQRGSDLERNTFFPSGQKVIELRETCRETWQFKAYLGNIIFIGYLLIEIYWG